LILVDTNIFLELLLNQKRADECEAFLERVSKGEEEAVVSHFSVHGIESFLGEGPALTNFLKGLATSKGLSIHESGLSEEIAVSMLAQSINRDFDDSLQYFLAKKLGAQSIVSFDGHLDGLDVERTEPVDHLPRK